MGYTIWPDSPDGDVLSDIHRERLRQEELRLKGKFKWTCSVSAQNAYDLTDMVPLGDAAKLAVLAEEFGEVSKLVVEAVISENRRDIKKLREELMQVASVAVAWCEALDNEEWNR